VAAAPLVRSLVTLRRDSVKLVSETAEWFLDFELDAKEPGVATAFFLAVGGLEAGANLTLSAPSSARSSSEAPFQAALKQPMRLHLYTGGDIRSQLSDNFDVKEDKFHVMLDLRAEQGDLKAVVAQRSFLQLTFDDAGHGQVHVHTQLVECANVVRALTPLYGTMPNPRKFGGSFEGGECVICLEKPKEVAILHCRHVCLCSSCAQITSSTWSFQCPVCRGRVAGMVGMSQVEVEAEDAQAGLPDPPPTHKAEL